MIRKATEEDLEAVGRLYEAIHSEEEEGRLTIGWQRGVYPTCDTAMAALAAGELFVGYDGDDLVGAAIINQKQVDAYHGAPWAQDAPDSGVMVLHTLAVSPLHSGKGWGRAFVSFYEQYAAEHGCRELRMDTNSLNTAARSLYAKLGYREIAIVPTVFNGMPDIDLVLLEKTL